jgi:hypothetical protein
MPTEEEQQDEIREVIQTMREIRNAIILVGLATGGVGQLVEKHLSIIDAAS